MTPKRKVLFCRLCNEIYDDVGSIISLELNHLFFACDPLNTIICVNRDNHKVVNSYQYYIFRGKEEYMEKLFDIFKEFDLIE